MEVWIRVTCLVPQPGGFFQEALGTTPLCRPPPQPAELLWPFPAFPSPGKMVWTTEVQDSEFPNAEINFAHWPPGMLGCVSPAKGRRSGPPSGLCFCDSSGFLNFPGEESPGAFIHFRVAQVARSPCGDQLPPLWDSWLSCSPGRSCFEDSSL